MTKSFMEKLEAQWAAGNHLCVGLDPTDELIPSGMNTSSFLKEIVDATIGVAAAYKPNAAFFEEADFARGTGTRLRDLVSYIRTSNPDIPIILDGKRADIGKTNTGYVRAYFGALGVDAVTLNPYLGEEALIPFLENADRGCVVLCRTSNKGAGEFQDLPVPNPKGDGTIPLYQYVAHRVHHTWNKRDNCMLVAGATYPGELEQIRTVAPDIPLLIPGIGTQGGDLRNTIHAARRRFLINSSSGIMFASRDPAEFARAAGNEARKLHGDIQALLYTMER